ncbi:MAG: GIY-YIG nuclease family protein [bacterium]|nr:GIY-YIG nuclease family protein [bacterium]
MYYFYILRCRDNTLYCGKTDNLEKRINEHNSGSSRSAKYTRGRTPVKLVYFEKFRTVGRALKREAEVKKWKKKKKEELVAAFKFL